MGWQQADRQGNWRKELAGGFRRHWRESHAPVPVPVVSNHTKAVAVASTQQQLMPTQQQVKQLLVALLQTPTTRAPRLTHHWLTPLGWSAG